MKMAGRRIAMGGEEEGGRERDREKKRSPSCSGEVGGGDGPVK